MTAGPGQTTGAVPDPGDGGKHLAPAAWRPARRGTASSVSPGGAVAPTARAGEGSPVGAATVCIIGTGSRFPANTRSRAPRTAAGPGWSGMSVVHPRQRRCRRPAGQVRHGRLGQGCDSRPGTVPDRSGPGPGRDLSDSGLELNSRTAFKGIPESPESERYHVPDVPAGSGNILHGTPLLWGSSAGSGTSGTNRHRGTDERKVVDPFVLPPSVPLPRRRMLEGHPGSSRGTTVMSSPG